uniref:T-box domain-containing protein n=1 Tax=Caenorhabditis tropicalis TaxID=1561998 RepID=A0A1I7V3R7_9PELO
MDSFFTVEIKQEDIGTATIKIEQDIEMDPFSTVQIKEEPIDTATIKMDPFSTAEVKQEPVDTVKDMKHDIKTDPFYTAEIKQEPEDTVAVKMVQDIKPLQNVKKNRVTKQKDPNLTTIKAEPMDTYDIKIEPVDTFDVKMEPLVTVKEEIEPIDTSDIENEPMETTEEERIVTVTAWKPSQWETTGIKSITVTTQRSRPKPQFGFVVTGLCPEERYRFLMKLELVDCYKYKYRADLGMFCRQSIEEMTPEQKQPAYVEHHLELMLGSFWTSIPIVFSEMFLSTAKKCKSDTFKVLTRRAYKASLVIKNEDGTILKEFCDPIHSFVIVSDPARNYEKETEKAKSGTKRSNEGDGTPAQKKTKMDNC